MKEDWSVVNGALLIVLRVSRLFGLAPVNIIPVDNGCRITLSKTIAHYGYVFLGIVFLAMMARGFIYIYYFPEYNIVTTLKIDIEDILNNIEIFAVLSIGVGSNWSRMKALVGYFTKNKKSNRSSDRNRIILIVLWLSSRPVLFVIRMIYLCLKQIPFVLIYFFTIYDVINFVTPLFEVMIFLITFEVHKGYKAIEDELTSLNNDINSGKKMEREIKKSVRALSKAYTDICDVNLRLGRSNSLLIVVLFSSYTIQLIFTLNNLSTPFSEETVWLVFHVLRTVLSIEPRYQISKAVENIKFQLENLTRRITPVGQEMPLETKVFHWHIILNDIELLPLGLFTMSRSLIGEMCGVVITYAIVVMQIT